jgi:endonuclease G
MKKLNCVVSLTILLTSAIWSQNIHIKLGLPDSVNLIYRNEYVISYDSQKKIPRWVSWYLDSTWLGETKRYKGGFMSDQGVKSSDYNGSGYDRGHLCPSNERTASPTMNRNTFLMSNITPQTKALNQGVWRNLEAFYESKSREKSIFVIAGTITHTDRRIKGKIWIPDSCYKIVIVFQNKVDSSSEVYSAKMPNIDGIRNDKWQKYKVTIRDLEISTGLNFLSALGEELQEYLETKK